MRKYIQIICVFIFTLLMIPSVVFAEDREVVIDFSKVYEDRSNLSLIQKEALDYLMYFNHLKVECARDNSDSGKEGAVICAE